VCAQYDRPAGVVRSFQVSENSVEPAKADGAFNLFTKDNCRAALRDETEHFGPEVACVVEAALLSSGREGLAGAGTGPHRLVVENTGHAEGEGPSANPREEMTLSEPVQVGRSNIDD